MLCYLQLDQQTVCLLLSPASLRQSRTRQLRRRRRRKKPNQLHNRRRMTRSVNFSGCHILPNLYPSLFKTDQTGSHCYCLICRLDTILLACMPHPHFPAIFNSHFLYFRVHLARLRLPRLWQGKERTRFSSARIPPCSLFTTE